ncbi:ABC transporter substrate-binding protein [Naasia lichenicola]|uniref:ABC transporter substrate-binding protein n=1 Tax=Naasia lichenicola TaxID=2565933 RepID=A0A4V6RZ15_9MICO|nr:ABC transporter substrate-binding protein [Naasia lichenicola]
MPRRRPLLLTAALLGISGLALAGCSTTGSDPADGRISVVASTDVYADIASAIGGDLVEVTAIIDSENQDPHEYEATARTQLALSRADVVLENGGGYDDFVSTLLSAAGNDDATVLDVADISGYDQAPADGEFNEHLWYDFPTMQKLADQLVGTLSALDPSGEAAFTANAAVFAASLDDLEAREAELAMSYSGEGAAITEPVPLYLLDAIGLENRTPSEFSEAVEEDTDVPVSVLDETLALFADGAVRVLVYNEQTTTSATEQILAAADDAGVPAVAVRETRPTGSGYLDWMNADLDALEAALSA